MSPRHSYLSIDTMDALGGGTSSTSLRDAHREALAAVAALADESVLVLNHGHSHISLAALISRCVEHFRVYHEILCDQRIPALRRGGPSGRALAAHSEHLVEEQRVLLDKLSKFAEKGAFELPLVREIVLSALLLTQDLEAQRHALGEIATVVDPRISGAA